MQQHHWIRRSIIAVLTGALVLPVVGAVAPLSVQARARCTQRVTGPSAGTLNVAAGEKLCVKRAQHTGDINVASGGALVLVKSTVDGAINLASGFTSLKFCSTQQTGGSAVSVDGGVRSILIGGTRKCKGNSMSGVVNITNNQAAVKMGKNTISGAANLNTNAKGISVSGNTIGGAVTVNGNLIKTVLSRNTITGALSCASNNPPPTNAGRPNQVTGARAGQCLAPFDS